MRVIQGDTCSVMQELIHHSMAYSRIPVGEKVGMNNPA